jgi:CO/xanthine dehydrogenase Mo-binding subunit
VALGPIFEQEHDMPTSWEFAYGPIEEAASFSPPHDRDSPMGHPALFFETGFGGAEVEVDRDTGVVELLRYASEADVGFAINWPACKAQDEGSVVMGIGHTFFERLEFSAGELINASSSEYRLPGIENLPSEEFTALLREDLNGPGPYGSKGAGESGIIPVAPAIANAIAAAAGIRIRDLPLTPERVWRALKEVEASSEAASGMLR